MAIHIADEETERLALEVAAKAGESLGEAVFHSLEERLVRLNELHSSSHDLVATILAIGRRCSSLPDLDRRDPDEILGYDSIGAFG